MEVVLSDDECKTLERWARRPRSAQAPALRCRIVLLCAVGATNTEVVERLSVSRDFPMSRSGVPRSITDDQVEAVIVKTLDETPTVATHWSTRRWHRARG